MFVTNLLQRPRRSTALHAGRTVVTIGMLLLGLQVSGCASFQKTTASNADAPGTAPQLQAWWQPLNDPLLQQLINQALDANHSVAASRAAVQQARALRDVEVANQRPQLTLSTSVQRNVVEESASINARAGLDARWEIDVFGSNQSALANRDAEVVVAQTNLRDVQLSMTAEVALAYIQLRGQQAQLEIAQRNWDSQQETLQLTQWRAQAGLLTSLEVEQAMTAVAQTAAQLPALRGSLAKTRHSLAVLTGQPPTELDAVLAPVQQVPQAPPRVADVIDADHLRQRADVRAAEARVAAALASVDAAQAARYPSFSLGGSVGLTALTLAGLSNGATVATTVLASMSVPLLDGGAANARVQVQQSAADQARANYQNTLLNALRDVADAMAGWRSDQERLVHLQQAATAADNAALLAKDRYASGLIDFQTVLQTQRTLLGAQDSLASIQAALSTDFVRLVKAVGGGWH